MITKNYGRNYYYLNDKIVADDQDEAYYAAFFKAKHIDPSSIKPITDAGRGGAYVFKHAQLALPLLHRRYRRGGLIGKFNADKFCLFAPFAQRAKLEFMLLDKLQQSGLNVPEAVIAHEERGTFFIKQELVIVYLPEALNLDEIMRQRSLSAQELDQIMQELSKLFALKVMHSDLNIKNILVANDKIYLIDFDKCYIDKHFSHNNINSMLQRLQRSLSKQEQLSKLQGHSFYGADDLRSRLQALQAQLTIN